ncbi:ankyrin repeat protein, putative [Trichomonas vaginalis G3]|uniref:Ankyrin repeat protein, putative n=1 Tax=Trichomonas vaginalis (strain ATCC PRA-98 / G3) TaxID=412133 RepID=A2DB50_TRIV3|nr:hypothetical protein TVAGG3_0509670 [Trichomonas vaginalis G3]EAY22380.1 ankyrin repeat protein, putative [Trichomonas vaginalis G3]KAI5517693.1 hypothetical protein TVAGG3_0509670 [Trichomonas vaginalis G3]|eukprot:XP_001583366.1 ankyrin repeat protein [Trichomonas vaginalis G3]
MSALHVSCAKGLNDVVKYFLERDDVDVNCKNEMGQTPIFECVNQGHNDILKMLLERKEIDIDVKDIFGQSIATMLRTIENNNVRETIEAYIKSKQ